MQLRTLGLAWNWGYDDEFVAGIERACEARGVTSYRIMPANVQETLQLLREGSLAFEFFLDRASDDDESFEPLVKQVARSSAQFFNPPDRVEHAKDKATMHLEFITKGLQVPYTIIVSPFSKKREPELSLSELAKLGRPFIIKPANTTGGGIGVVLGAETLKDVIETRQHHKNDKYLLQEKIIADRIGPHKAWFRVFWAFGQAVPCWWDDETHVYTPVSSEEITLHSLGELDRIAGTIARICKLDFFSTEIAKTAAGAFVVVDYVNDICDMRLQSRFNDGVPDLVVHGICARISYRCSQIEVPHGIPSNP